MTNKIRTPNDKTFRVSSFLRISTFVLRHSSSYEIDLVALLQSHYRFLPPRPAPKRPAQAFFFSSVIARIHIDDCFLKQMLDCVLDLDLVGLWADAKDILVLLLAHQRRLFRQRRGLNDVVWLVHSCAVAFGDCGRVLSANISRAF